jgi:phage virion morphogenesis protein
MSHDLIAVEAWAAAVLQRLSPGERRRFLRSYAAELRRSQAERIAAQKNPDGSDFEPRKVQPGRTLRDKAGRVRRRGPMFKKLRTAKRLKVTEATETAVSVGFTGRDAAIASVSQFGRTVRVGKEPSAPMVRFAVRRLVGLTDQEREAFARRFLDQLT